MRTLCLAFPFLLVLGACGGDKEGDGVACGDATCAEGEFCLTEYVDGAEAQVCAGLPEGCESADQMCFGDPEECVEDWSAEVCPDAFGTGCIGIGSSVEVTCDYGSSTTSY